MAVSLMSHLARQRQLDLRDEEGERHSREILKHMASAVGVVATQPGDDVSSKSE